MIGLPHLLARDAQIGEKQLRRSMTTVGAVLDHLVRRSFGSAD
jgi:hypothetical protein